MQPCRPTKANQLNLQSRQESAQTKDFMGQPEALLDSLTSARGFGHLFSESWQAPMPTWSIMTTKGWNSCHEIGENPVRRHHVQRPRFEPAVTAFRARGNLQGNSILHCNEEWHSLSLSSGQLSMIQ